MTTEVVIEIIEIIHRVGLIGDLDHGYHLDQVVGEEMTVETVGDLHHLHLEIGAVVADQVSNYFKKQKYPILLLGYSFIIKEFESII